ncbi:MAG TPA: acetate/propionate family kinase [Candidatus Limnocylindrales bacterium]
MARVLVINAGSSSLKVSVVDPLAADPVGAATIDWGSDATQAVDRRASLERALTTLPHEVAAAAHRVVHGGNRFRAPTLVDDGVLDELDRLSELAPLHNPVAVETIRAQRDLRPELPCVALFDTAFHASLEKEAYIYPLPYAWFSDWGVRRFGFHGLSVEWSVMRAAELLDVHAGQLSLVVAHLGSGCSVTAVQDGRSVWTSMGFTPLEGLVMGTRSGSVDPGVLLYAMRQHGITAIDLERILDHESGLLGISGTTGDVRELVSAADNGNDRARLALEIFERRAAEEIAAAATHLERLDAIVFTGGIGQNAAGLRASICSRLRILGLPRGVSIEGIEEDSVLSGGQGSVAVLRITAREDIVMARAALALVPSQ